MSDHRFSSIHRESISAAMEQEQWDVLVIGGGITGAGIALDAQTRGMSTALIEMQDFAAGTSSRSTKLVHGGLRYLKQLELKLVAEVGRERAIVHENGPHVTSPVRMTLPIYHGGTFGKWGTRLGLALYDVLAGVKKDERYSMLSADDTLAMLPGLKKEGLKGAGHYVEYRTDDARLTLEVMKKAVSCGAKAINYMKAERFLYEGDRLIGVEAVDQISGATRRIYANTIVNATGPWVDTLRELDRSKQGRMLRLTKGVHLVIDSSRFPLQHAVYMDAPDGRMIFAIPRDGKVYIGTTDTDYSGDPAHPGVTVQDRDYLLAAVNRMFPSYALVPEDVESSWAGLRPLIYEEGKAPSDISRKDEIFQSKSGLITIAGGKLTGYRLMAERIVDLIAKRFRDKEGRVYPPCRTAFLPLSGGEVGGSAGYSAFVENKLQEGVALGMLRADAEMLVRRYGSNISQLYACAEALQPAAKAYGLPLPLLLALNYAIHHEMAAKPADFLIRRTGDLLFNLCGVKQWSASIVAIMAQELCYTDEQRERFTSELQEEIDRAGCQLHS